MEQVAADELWPDEPKAVVATHFLRLGIYEYNQRNVKPQWASTIDDITAVTGGDITDAANAGTALTDIDAALDTLNSERALYGATQNRFESIIGVLQVSAENQAAAKSRITDADFAAETANLSRAQILQQAGSAMIAQANQLPQQVLSLLR